MRSGMRGCIRRLVTRHAPVLCSQSPLLLACQAVAAAHGSPGCPVSPLGSWSVRLRRRVRHPQVDCGTIHLDRQAEAWVSDSCSYKYGRSGWSSQGTYYAALSRSEPRLRISGQHQATSRTTRMVPIPPSTTEETGPNTCAVSPDS